MTTTETQPTIEDLTTQELTRFVVTGAPISGPVAGHLRRLDQDQLTEVGNSIPAESEDFNPDRRQWVANMALRGSALIDRMAEADDQFGARPDRTGKAEIPGKEGKDIRSGTMPTATHGRHTRASLGHYLTQELPGKEFID